MEFLYPSTPLNLLMLVKINISYFHNSSPHTTPLLLSSLHPLHHPPATMIEDYQGDTPTTRFIMETLHTYSEDGDLEFEQELIDSYKQSVTDHLPKLKLALEENDIKNATLYSHDIKGSCLYIGADAVRFVSGKMEALCRAEKLAEAASHLEELETEVEEVLKILDKYIEDRLNGGSGENVEEKKEKEEEETKSSDASE